MSILIRSNVHLPRSCRKCPFNGGDWCIASEKVRIGKHGNVNEHRHPDCPLVEIPTPHGRLIDADKAATSISMMNNHPCGNSIETVNDVVEWLRFANENGNNIAFPTIIEAEVSE